MFQLQHSHHQAGYEKKKEKFTVAQVSDLRTLQDNVIYIYIYIYIWPQE